MQWSDSSQVSTGGALRWGPTAETLNCSHSAPSSSRARCWATVPRPRCVGYGHVTMGLRQWHTNRSDERHLQADRGTTLTGAFCTC